MAMYKLIRILKTKFVAKSLGVNTLRV